MTAPQYYPVSPTLLWEIRRAAANLEAAIPQFYAIFAPAGYIDDTDQLQAAVDTFQAARRAFEEPVTSVLYQAAVSQDKLDQIRRGELAADGVSVGNGEFSARIYEIPAEIPVNITWRPFGVGEDGG